MIRCKSQFSERKVLKGFSRLINYPVYQNILNKTSAVFIILPSYVPNFMVPIQNIKKKLIVNVINNTEERNRGKNTLV